MQVIKHLKSNELAEKDSFHFVEEIVNQQTAFFMVVWMQIPYLLTKPKRKPLKLAQINLLRNLKPLKAQTKFQSAIQGKQKICIRSERKSPHNEI